MTEREPEWSDEDRAWLRAYLKDKNERCPGCGNYPDECRSPTTAGRWQVVHQTCEACRVAEADAEALAEEKPRRRGVYTAVVLR